jgi:H+/Cl- antiporter ClcA
MGKSRVYQILSELNQLKWSVAYKGVLVGLVSGLLVTIYRLGIEFGTEKAIEAYGLLRTNPVYLLPWAAAIALAGFVTYRLIKWEPYATGSGIPQVEAIVLFGMRIRWYTVLAVRYIAGIVTSFFGVSLGREGPSIQLGAAGGQAISKKIAKNKLEENCLITAGASAGLSAAFSAPLSGIIFALEEVHRTFSPNILIAATTAALSADVVSKYFFGLKPILYFGDIPQLPLIYYLWLLPLGVVCGLLGAGINKGLLGMGRLYGKAPDWTRPAAALLLALPCGMLLPQVLGGGQNLVELSEAAQTGMGMLALFLAVKLLFTCTSFGSGIPGGIFMPILSMGALAGCIFGEMVAGAGMPAQYIPVFCVCAMAGAMSGSVKAPITSILLMAEMAGSLTHLMPVAAVAFTALLTSDLLKVSPIYEELLDGMVGQNTQRAHKGKGGSLIETPVELGSDVDGRLVGEVAWPKGALVVGIRRGNSELVPHGDTRIMHGDYLVVLSSQQRFEEMNRQILELCRSR